VYQDPYEVKGDEDPSRYSDRERVARRSASAPQTSPADSRSLSLGPKRSSTRTADQTAPLG
jgi:hypothetical protein